MINYLYLNSVDYSRAMGKALENYLTTKMSIGHVEDLAINSAEFFEASYYSTTALGEELYKKIKPINNVIAEIINLHHLSETGSGRESVFEEVLAVIEKNLKCLS